MAADSVTTSLLSPPASLSRPSIPSRSAQQRDIMSGIVSAMQRADVGSVAQELQAALAQNVSLPAIFLQAVREWMTARFPPLAVSSSRQLERPTLTPNVDAGEGKTSSTRVPAHVHGVQDFGSLHQMLELAVWWKSEPDIQAILHRGAELAGASIGKGGGLSSALPGMPSHSGALGPLGSPAAAVDPAAATTAHSRRDAARRTSPRNTSQPLSKRRRAAEHKDWTADVQTPSKIQLAHSKTTKSSALKQEKLEALYSPSMVGDEPRSPSTQSENSLSVLGAEDVKPGPSPCSQGSSRRPSWTPRSNAASADDRLISPVGLLPKTEEKAMGASKLPPRTHGFSREDSYALKKLPSAEDIAAYLRTRTRETALLRDVQLHLDTPGRECIREAVEMQPDVFVLKSDKVSLREDPAKKIYLNQFCATLVSSHLTRKRIQPDDQVFEVVVKAASLALQAPPQGVGRILEHVANHTVKRFQRVERGSFPANMPLVLACIIDRIVMIERDEGGPKHLEDSLGPVIFSAIFRRWVLGIVPGSQFLTNLLLTWERLGYFKAKHIDKCKRRVMLLAAYARSDGVPDRPDKDSGTGWYRFVQRADGVEGCCAITPLQHSPKRQRLSDAKKAIKDCSPDECEMFSEEALIEAVDPKAEVLAP